MHIIRLRSAWEPSTAEDTDTPTQRFERSFGKPTNLGDGERVFLVIAPHPTGEVRLNGAALPIIEPAEPQQFRHDITSSLNSRNLLAIETDSPTFDHEVRLEIVE